ncbi:MAG: type IV toxin-antitoxin system AbiEi family antitoxin domain-containing protein [Burkholderiales bacterium]|nr:type IV toxin-antitoxin system AbiEi family antitoxin domain-containing protein [Burkholderiales bacterium]
MVEQRKDRLNPLLRLLPPGQLVSASWLREREYPTNLVAYYVANNRLESPARGVYRVPGPPLKWQSVVASLQLNEASWSHVGGATAIVQRGLGHYARLGGAETIQLFGPDTLPPWVNKLKVPEKFEQRSDAALSPLRVRRDEKGVLHRFGRDEEPISPDALGELGLAEIKWGTFDWPLIFSSEERAILELLEHVPERESVYEAYVLLQGLVNLRPERVSGLLRACHSVKAKRLFLALAARIGHAWFKYLDLKSVNLGSGKRALFPGGKLDSKYQITLPADLDEHAR